MLTSLSTSCINFEKICGWLRFVGGFIDDFMKDDELVKAVQAELILFITLK